MGVDACAVGWCKLYDGGNGTFGFMVGICVGIALAALVQYFVRKRKK